MHSRIFLYLQVLEQVSGNGRGVLVVATACLRPKVELRAVITVAKAKGQTLFEISQRED